MNCDHERQVYFGAKLPCPRRDCPEVHRAPDVTIAVMAPRSRSFSAGIDAFDPYATGAVRVIFERSDDYTRWVPRPCVDATVDAALTEKLVNGGLARALIGYVRPAENVVVAPPKAATMRQETHAKLARIRELLDMGCLTERQAAEAAEQAIQAEIDPLIKRINDVAARAATSRIGAPIWNIPHNPTPEPWRPTVDDWDLLPDA